MKYQQFATALVFAGASVFLVSCGGTESTAGDEAAIKDINAKWQEMIAAKDAKGITALYADQGSLLPPNAPKAVGHDAIEQGWNGVVGTPGLSLTWQTEGITFAKSGDLAVETQTYKFVSGEGAAQVTDTGKSVVTWVKKDGKWQVWTDMFSSDAAPAAPAAPAAEPLAAPADGTAAPAEGAPAPAAGTTEAPAAPAPAAPAPATPAPAAPAKPPAH